MLSSFSRASIAGMQAQTWFETCSVWDGEYVAGIDGNPIPSAVTEIPEAESVPCNIHRGSRQAVDDALAIGIDANLIGLGYFEKSFSTHLKRGRVVLDGTGQAWVIRGIPSLVGRIPETQRVRALLQLLTARPDGLP